MIEFEHIVNQIQRLHEKEKGIRNKVLLENALVSLKEYDRVMNSNNGDTTIVKK